MYARKDLMVHLSGLCSYGIVINDMLDLSSIAICCCKLEMMKVVLSLGHLRPAFQKAR